MPRLKRETWVEIRIGHEVHCRTYRDLAREFDISHQAIAYRARREGWRRLEAEVVRRALSKVAAELDGLEVKKRDGAVEAEAARRAAVIDKHRAELEYARQMAIAAKLDHESVEDRVSAEIEDPVERQQILLAAKRAAFETLKAAKIHAETVKIVQEGERKAWGLDLIVDVTQLTDEQLAALAAGRMPS